MSYHEIEDIVEDCVHFVDKSSLSPKEKKQRIQELFSFQALFDTGNTFGRVENMMKSYALTRENIYISNLQALPLFADILELSILQNPKLSREIYSVFMNAFLNEEIGEENGIPKKALNLAENKDFLRIRKILELHPNLCKKDARSEESDNYSYFPDITGEIEFEKDPEKKAILSLFAEPKKTIAQIQKNLEKQLALVLLEDPWKIVYHFFQKYLSGKDTLSCVVQYKDTFQISFTKKLSSAAFSGYETICIELDAEEKYMNLYLGFQLENVLSWQKREASPFFELQHDFLYLEAFLQKEDTEKNSHRRKMGGWKYDRMQSEKKLVEHCENMLQLFEKYETQMLNFYSARIETFQNFSLTEFQKEISLIQEFYIIPLEHDYIFSGPEGALAYLISYHQSVGNFEIVKSYLSLFENILDARVSPKRKNKHLAYEAFFSHENDIFPEFFHGKNIFFDESQKKILILE